MSDKKTIVTVPLAIEIGTTTELKTIELNTKGRVTAIDITGQGDFADMFIGAEISYPIQKGQISKIRGYLKTSIPLTWQGSIPIDTESELIIEHLNAAAETINIVITTVIEHE